MENRRGQAASGVWERSRGPGCAPENEAATRDCATFAPCGANDATVTAETADRRAGGTGGTDEPGGTDHTRGTPPHRLHPEAARYHPL